MLCPYSRSLLVDEDFANVEKIAVAGLQTQNAPTRILGRADLFVLYSPHARRAHPQNNLVLLFADSPRLAYCPLQLLLSFA